MFSFVKSIVRSLPPFNSLVRQRQYLHDRLVDAEMQLRERDRALAAMAAQAAKAREREAAQQPILDLHAQGNRFGSGVIHPTHLNAADWDVVNRHYEGEADIKKWIEQVMPFTMVTYDGLVSLADQVRYCEQNNVPGCYVEAGTWKGGAAAMMAFANLHYGNRRRQIYLFDSFQGIPEPNASRDDAGWIEKEMHLSLNDCRGQLRSIDRLVGGQHDVEKVFFDIARYPHENVEIVPGWFQDTVAHTAVRMGPIAILRLDGDLYDSIRVCLEHLFPLLVAGGFLIIDDWCLSGARQAVTEFFASQPGRPPYMCYGDATVRYFIKQ